MSRGLDIAFAAPAANSGGFVAWDPQVDLNPRHYWRASNVVADGSNLISQINDLGRVGGKPFTASGSNRPLLGIDSPSGQAAIFPDGIDDHLQAGAAADWKFLSDGSQWTAVFCYQSAAISAAQYLASTTSGAGGATGTWFLLAYNSATAQGPWIMINNGSGGNVIDVEDRRAPFTGVNVCAIVHCGATNPTNTFIKCQNTEMIMRHGGVVSSEFVMKQGDTRNAYNTGNPNGPLTLFSSTTFGGHFAGRLFEAWIDDRIVPQRHLLEYEKWCNSRYRAAV